mgnify:FL=1
MTTTATKEYTIRDIETLTEAQAAEMATEATEIKGHQIYFVDFGGYFGFSVLVFADGHHIKYANDYELHHKGKNRDELREFYLDSLRRKLFTADEMETVSDYQDKQAKEYYIRNYYGLRRDHVSMFFCGPDEEREKLRKKTENMIFSHVFLAFYDKKDADFVKSGEKLLAALENAEPDKSNSEYWKSAFLREMFNHEYGINWQADFDVCSCFGNCSSVANIDDLNALFDACNFSDVQRAAYMAARREYSKQSAELY